MFNLSSLKAVILGLSFKDMRDFVRGIAVTTTDHNDDNQMVVMDAITDWAEKYEPPEGEVAKMPEMSATVDAEGVLQDPADEPPPPPERDVHLDIPSGTDFMILTAKVPNDMAEEFQKKLPDSTAIMYACDFVEKKEMMNDKYWAIYGRNCWEQFFT